MSVTVLYNGQRKKIKINSTTSTVQFILDDAAKAFQIDSTSCELQHNRKILDKGQLFRFTGVSNNATLDLILTNNSKGNSEVKIALTAEEIGSKTANFSSNQTLRDVLLKFIADDFIPSDIFLRSPVIVYLRQQFLSDQLDTPLQSLGLASGGARLQLRFDQIRTNPEISQQPFTSPSSAPPSGKEETREETREELKEELKEELSEKTASEILVHDSSAVRTENGISNHSPPTPSLPSLVSLPNPSDNQSISSHSVSLQKPTIEESLKLCHQMINSNFDCVSTPAVITMTKYLDNLIKSPFDQKYRIINTQNRIFAENISNVKGALDVLYSIGYLPITPTYLQSLVPSSSSSQAATSEAFPSKLYFQFETIFSENDSQTLVSSIAISTELLRSIRENVFVAIMNELNIPLENRPPPPLSSFELSSAVASPPSLPALVPFDPFKPLIIRTSNQPRPVSAEVISSDGAVSIPLPSERKTETEIRLSKLIKKRDEMMGERQNVERRTKVSLSVPYHRDQREAEPKFTVDARDLMEVENDDPGSDSFAMKAMMRKYSKAIDGEDNSPLTTKAVRDLEKIRNQTVYTQTLIKIRFPDQICLEAYFHPQDSIQDIRDWLIHFCFHSSLSTSPSSSFELYITPPRQVLPLEVTLQELKLVPAAVLYLSWSLGFTQGEEICEKEDRNPSLPGCYYLTEHLYRKANSIVSGTEVKGESETTKNEFESEIDFGMEIVNHFPQGQKLVKPKEKDGSGDINPLSSGGGGSDGSEADSKGGRSSSSAPMKKPKWLKT